MYLLCLVKGWDAASIFPEHIEEGPSVWLVMHRHQPTLKKEHASK